MYAALQQPTMKTRRLRLPPFRRRCRRHPFDIAIFTIFDGHPPSIDDADRYSYFDSAADISSDGDMLLSASAFQHQISFRLMMPR